MKTKGIFCLEGLWDNDLRKKSTVEPILRLLWLREGIQYIHRDCATYQEFEFYMSKFSQQRYANFPILYLAFHGEQNGIYTSDSFCSLDEISDILKEKCSRKIIILGSCDTLDTDQRHLKRFLRKTGALAICGYRTDVDWMLASAFELLLLSKLQENYYDGRGILAIKRKTEEIGKLFKKLKFRIVVKD